MLAPATEIVHLERSVRRRRSEDYGREVTTPPQTQERRNRTSRAASVWDVGNRPLRPICRRGCRRHGVWSLRCL